MTSKPSKGTRCGDTEIRLKPEAMSCDKSSICLRLDLLFPTICLQKLHLVSLVPYYAVALPASLPSERVDGHQKAPSRMI